VIDRRHAENDPAVVTGGALLVVLVVLLVEERWRGAPAEHQDPRRAEIRRRPEAPGAADGASWMRPGRRGEVPALRLPESG
jgi:hypothetical protein